MGVRGVSGGVSVVVTRVLVWQVRQSCCHVQLLMHCMTWCTVVWIGLVEVVAAMVGVEFVGSGMCAVVQHRNKATMGLGTL